MEDPNIFLPDGTNYSERKRQAETVKAALTKVKEGMRPMARQIKSWALDSKNWIRAGNPIFSDTTLRNKYSCQFGDIICTYFLEDHGQRGVYHFLCIQFLSNFLTLPNTVIDELVELFMEECKGEVQIRKQPALQTFFTGSGVEHKPVYELYVAIAPYKGSRIAL